MSRKLHATFDGAVLKPEESAGLEPNKRYLVTVDEADDELHRLAVLAEMAEDFGVSDLAWHHKEYARKRC